MNSALMPTYKRADLAFDHGEGCWLYTENKGAYLDFASGIATSSLGHRHPRLTKAIHDQAQRVIHVANLYKIPQAEKLAHLLCENSFAQRAFFCNSGSEANEGMVKMVRRAQAKGGHPERHNIICMQGAFHGRTLAMLSATGNEKYLDGFGKAVEGFSHVPFNDIGALEEAITPETAAIMMEPIQGESGIRPSTLRYLHQLRQLCDKYGVFLAFDEVQCGVGRTGKLFAYQWSDIAPDILTTAKGLAGGVPIGAILATKQIADVMTPGTHGSTFGGNPLACGAATVVIEEILSPGFLQHICQVSAHMGELLDSLIHEYPQYFSFHCGKGLLIGLKCLVDVKIVQRYAQDCGLLTVPAGHNILRLVPPLIVTDKECELAYRKLKEAAQKMGKDGIGQAGKSSS